MSAISASNSGTPGSTFRLFGMRAGDFGLFASTLIAVALGFITFFGVTFLSIFGLLIYNSAGHHHVTLDTGYKFIALPAGIFVLIVSYAGLLAIWARRKVTGR